MARNGLRSASETCANPERSTTWWKPTDAEPTTVPGIANTASMAKPAVPATRSANFMSARLRLAGGGNRRKEPSTGRYPNASNCERQKKGAGIPAPSHSRKARDLLLRRLVMRRTVVQRVVIGDRHGLAVLADRRPRPADHLAVALVRLHQRVPHHLHAHAGNPRVAFHRRFRSVHLRRVRLAGRSRHRQHVAISLVGDGHAVVGKALEARGDPRTRNRM